MQGYAADFLPWLLPLHAKHLSQLASWSHKIRDFMTDSIVQQRLDSWESASDPDQDYVDELIGHVRGNAQPAMTWDTAMFALEDIVGGHSAVGNLLVKVSVGTGRVESSRVESSRVGGKRADMYQNSRVFFRMWIVIRGHASKDVRMQSVCFDTPTPHLPISL